MKTSLRSEKLAGIISEKIPGIITQYLTPDQVGFITVTAVEVSGDLGVADILESSIGGPSGYLKLLKKYTKKFTYELLKQISLRRPIILRFKIDKSVAYVEKLNQKFKQNN